MAEATVATDIDSAQRGGHTFREVSISGRAHLGDVYNNIYQSSNQFRLISDWLSPPDPWTNHTSAFQRYEPQTGIWLLQSDQYRRWKNGSTSIIWVHGKAGCGKTVLCSAAIEDIRAHCATAINSFHAMFYFSFSDDQKQTYQNFLRSLVVQLGWKEPGLSMLVQAYQKHSRSVPGLEDLERILIASIESFDEVFVFLDALDECSETGEVRQSVLDGLERMSQRLSNLRILITSREVSDIRDFMGILGADALSIASASVDADIQKWVSSQVLGDRKLDRLDTITKALIRDTISQKADGMFRWAYCQLQELKKLKAAKPKYIKAALLSLPSTLDETYERMLYGIEELYRDEALRLLRWLAYSQSPPTLRELAEAAIIDPTADVEVDVDNRGEIDDTLNILCGLVTVEGLGDGDYDYNDENSNNVRRDEIDRDVGEPSTDSGTKGSNFKDDHSHSTQRNRRLKEYSTIRLAHFSVKEYLESKRILQSCAKGFSLESTNGHNFLAQSCLTYILHYNCSNEKTSTERDFIAFPLLNYAARSWFYHSSLQQSDEVSRETKLLSSKDAKHDWLLVYNPDQLWRNPFKGIGGIWGVGGAFYYASLLGLESVVSKLLLSGADVNAERGGEYNNALQAASAKGHEEVVEVLINGGAHVNAEGGGIYSNALEAASAEGHEKVVETLINAGANVNAEGEALYSSALEAASAYGHEKIVKRLINAGADVNAREQGLYGTALQVASVYGHEKVVDVLINAGVDVNARGGLYGSALQAASADGYENVVERLINAGADVNTEGGLYGSALEAAERKHREKIVDMLIAKGARKYKSRH